jgi:hypothetical protein
MLIGRRTFILGTTLFAAASGLAKLLSLSSTAQSNASLVPDRLPSQPAGGADVNCLRFKIDGWDRCDGIAIDGARAVSADPITHIPPDEQLWISINQSWRTAWR